MRFKKLAEVKATLYVCPDCGAVVQDKRTHEKWHKA